MGWFLFRRSGLEVLEDYGPYVGLKRILVRIRRVQGFGISVLIRVAKDFGRFHVLCRMVQGEGPGSQTTCSGATSRASISKRKI